MFASLTGTNFHFWVIFILLFANPFNLDKLKILSFGKELNEPKQRAFENIFTLVGKGCCRESFHIKCSLIKKEQSKQPPSFNCLTKPQILDSPKVKEFADDNFELDESGIKFSKLIENTVGKRAIAHNEQFLLFPECFPKACTADT